MFVKLMPYDDLVFVFLCGQPLEVACVNLRVAERFAAKLQEELGARPLPEPRPFAHESREAARARLWLACRAEAKRNIRRGLYEIEAARLLRSCYMAPPVKEPQHD